MATKIPNDVEEFQTEGERVLFRFLQSVVRPDSRYLAWYLPDVNGKEPDFLLYGDDVKNIILLDRQEKGIDHRALQRSIEKVVEHENYEWQTLRVQEDGKIKVE
jgi:hypothetical protein